MFLNRLGRISAAQVAVVLTAAAAAVGISASPASAGCTGHTVWNPAPNEYDTVQASGGLHLRKGPHTSCGSVQLLSNGTRLESWCYDYGTVVNGVSTWSYVRVIDNGRSGWVHDSYLLNNGANTAC